MAKLLSELSKAELVNLASQNGVPVEDKATKADIVQLLDEVGIQPVEPEPVVVEAPVAVPAEEVETPVVNAVAEKVLIKMVRKNPTFQTHGVKFTRENPFAVVDADVADSILDRWEGFVLASPREAREFFS